MDSWSVAYQIALFIAFACSFLVLKNSNKSLIIFPILFFFANTTELIVAFEKHNHKINYPYIYHFYIPIEYILLGYFYYLNSYSKKVRSIILYSIPLFIIACLYISICAKPNEKYPTLQFNIEGLLIITWVLISLFSLKSEEDINIFKHPFLWINIGLLFFHSGNFFLMGSYNYLLNYNLPLAKKLFKLINTTLNLLLFIFFIIGFICSTQTRKL